jgi:hypothetical protein
MRPAPPRQPRPDGESSSPTEPSIELDPQSNRVSRVNERSALRRRRLIWIAAAVVALALAGLAFWLLTNGSTPSIPAESPAATQTASPTIPVRPAFVFSVRPRQPAATGKLKRGAADDASIEIGARLSAFYDAVFMDPNTWKNGVPKDAWAIFETSAGNQAKKDADALTLADQVPDLTNLSVSESSLAVKVLLDPAGKPYAAAAQVDFIAVGTLQSGGTVTVTNHAAFVLQLEGGQWLVTAFPSASTDVESAAATPTATPTQSATP